jgi:hypothetical protein
LTGRDSHPLDEYSKFQDASDRIPPFRPAFPGRFHIQVFNRNDTKFPDQTSRQRMQRALACLAHPGMSARDSHTLLLASVAPLLPPCETALLLAQVLRRR